MEAARLLYDRREAARQLSISVRELDMKASLRKRLLFHSKETYEAVERVQQLLQNLMAEGLFDRHNARSFWEDVLNPSIENAVTQLFEQLRVLMDDDSRR